MEERLWRICEKLRDNIDVRDYKHVILPIFFLRRADLNFNKRLKEIESMKHFSGDILPEFFNQYGGIYLPEDARWNYLLDCAKKEVPNLDARLDRAFRIIMEDNPELEGLFENNFIASLNINPWRLSKVILEIDKINYKVQISDNDAEIDEINLTAEILRTTYMLLLQKFSAKETRGKNRGEYYTPLSIMNYLKKNIDFKKYKTVYDPCIGMGGMISPFLCQHKNNVEIYGQEINKDTLKFTKLDLVMQGYNSHLAIGDTLENDAFKNLKVDCVLCNPPFNLKTKKYQNANYEWLKLCVNKISKEGIVIAILPGTALVNPNYIEDRKTLVKNNVSQIVNLPIDSFNGVKTPISIWILNKKVDDSITFIDNRGDKKVCTIPRQTVLNDKNISLAPSYWLEIKPVINPEENNLTNEIERKIHEKEMEIRKLKGLLDFTFDWSKFKNLTLNNLIEEIESKDTIKPNEFAINLIHIGRDKKLPITINTSDHEIKVPKSYLKFKIREKWQKAISPELLKIILSNPDFIEQLALLSDKSYWGEVKKEEFLATKIN